MLVCFNKFLCDYKPASEVCSPDKLHWLEARVKHCGPWEDEFFIFSFDKSSQMS